MSEPLERVVSKMLTSVENCCEYGISFHFKLPKKGLALRAVALDDGLPKFIFDAANSPDLPTITEEDVATVARLVKENKRPEFFYIAFPPGHPYFRRQYKQYSPQWMRGTSIGDLLSEADWKMKCLSIGARTNESKTKFWSWQNTSNMEDLATSLDFPTDKLNGSIKMSCKSVKVQKNSNNMIFVDEPKMKINDETNLCYTKYITEIYDSVAYYDEPLFLKMQELPKLILAVEWLKEQGVTFSEEWIMRHTNKTRPVPSQAIEVKESQMTDGIFEQVATFVSELSDEIQVTETTRSGLKWEVQSESENEIRKFGMSVNDHDILYHDFDPKEPLGLNETGEPIVPDVDSWSELFSETVPWPRVWKFPYVGIGLLTAGGGVTTKNIPVSEVPITHKTSTSSRQKESVVRKGPYSFSDGKLGVTSSTMKQKSTKPPKEMVPKQHIRKLPPSSVPVNTREAWRNRAVAKIGGQDMYGWCDEGSFNTFDSDGKPLVQGQSLKAAGKSTNKEKEECRFYMNVPLSPTLTEEVPSLLPVGPSPVPSSDSGIGILPPGQNVPNPMDTTPMDDGCFSPIDSGANSPSKVDSGDEMEQ